MSKRQFVQNADARHWLRMVPLPTASEAGEAFNVGRPRSAVVNERVIQWQIAARPLTPENLAVSIAESDFYLPRRRFNASR